MKAITIPEPGDADALVLADVPEPEPGPAEVLVTSPPPASTAPT